MKIRLLAVGKLKDPLLREKSDVYLQRLRPLVLLKEEEVRDFPVRKGIPTKIAVEKEAEFLEERLQDNTFYVALDEKGRQKTTDEWVELFRRWEHEGKKEVVFLMGGAFGLSEGLLRGARERLALSKLTFTHELARLVFFEQVYRVFTQLRGIPYHHGG